MKTQIRRTSGATMIEMLVAAVLFTTVLVIVARYQQGARQMEERVTEVNGALRSVMLATEFIRFDIGRALVHDGASRIQVAEDGRSFSLTISDAPPEDMEKFTPVRVTYELEPEPASADAKTPVYRLVRKAPGSTVHLKDCWLTELTALDVPVGGVSPHLAYFEILLVGTDSAEAGERFISSQLIPYEIPQEPPPYSYIPAKADA